MPIEFVKSEIPNRPQHEAATAFAAWQQLTYWCGIAATALCMLASFYVGFNVIGSGGLIAVGVGLGGMGLDACKPSILIQLSSLRHRRDRFFNEIAKGLFIVTIVWAAVATIFFSYWMLVEPAVVFLLIGLHVVSALLPAFAINGARAYKESYDLDFITPQMIEAQNAGMIEPPKRETVRADKVHTEQIEWVWPQMVPRGELVIIAGPGGTGKTSAALSLCAAVSSGTPLPGMNGIAKGRCLIIEAEDPLESVTIPDLKAAGANLSAIRVAQYSAAEVLTPDVLEDYARDITDLKIVVLSPIRILLHDSNSTYRDIWQAMNALLQWGRRRGVTLLAIMHPVKGKTNVLAGSDAYLSLSRMVLLASRTDKFTHDGEPVRALTVHKSNIAIVGRERLYTIRGDDVDGIECKRIDWLNGRDVASSAPRIADTDTVTDTGSGPKNVISVDFNRHDTVSVSGNEADAWLAQRLAAGPQPLQNILQDAKSVQINERRVYRAADRLGVVKENGRWRLR